MPIRTFDVESYYVMTAQYGALATGTQRVLELTSPDLAHGIRDRAKLYFHSTEWGNFGVVLNVDQLNYDGLTIIAFCNLADFAQWYDILRNEEPLKFTFNFGGADQDVNDPIRQLFWIQLYTGEQEPPGEGPEQTLQRLLPADVLNVLREKS